MESLARRAWQLHALARGRGLVALVDPSCPILYFGDTCRYFASPLRVATVGLNPSLAEFPSNDPYQRFPATAAIDDEIDDEFASKQQVVKQGGLRLRPRHLDALEHSSEEDVLRRHRFSSRQGLPFIITGVAPFSGGRSV